MEIVSTLNELRGKRKEIERLGLSVGFVPTMGALHEGHLSLVRRSKRENDITFVSIFVNPTQFAPGEDLEKYPRTLEADTELLLREEVDLLFAPQPEEMYPESPCLAIDIPSMTNLLCGAKRPGHFNGVLLIVSKLFVLIRPNRTYFGKKDFQQLAIVKRMAKDLSFGVEVIGCEIVREQSGLAMSSRNVYLSETERELASSISKALAETKLLFEKGEQRSGELLRHCRSLLEESGISGIDYLELCDKITLLKKPVADRDSVLIVAVFVSSTRLIDNMEF